jgi:hypothetical protein
MTSLAQAQANYLMAHSDDDIPGLTARIVEVLSASRTCFRRGLLVEDEPIPESLSDPYTFSFHAIYGDRSHLMLRFFNRGGDDVGLSYSFNDEVPEELIETIQKHQDLFDGVRAKTIELVQKVVPMVVLYHLLPGEPQ